MEQAQRSTLYRTVVQCRVLLEEDFTSQLEGTYGVHLAGEIEPLSRLGHLDAVGRADREAIEAAIQHERSQGLPVVDAVDRFLRESAFTFLNRLAALKLLEHPDRALIPPTIQGGDQSKGMKQFALISPEAIRGRMTDDGGRSTGDGGRSTRDGGYRLYLELLFDDLAQVLGVLFDRSAPTSILFPTWPCLNALLELLNARELEPVWGEDETIGWIYQFFTPGELRERARKQSSAPRNSYELAFRNQFYTPRYVVSFLVENTLGRLWWQMRGGETRLVGECRYLVLTEDGQRRMGDGGRGTENAPSPVHRLPSPYDPRELAILDPACGSGHFLLGCFDLLRVIYEEAYDDPELGARLREEFPEKGSFRRAIPKLIVEHNLYGVDIDLRACQIASLALWLRAQRAYAEMGIKTRQRPPVRPSHIVCAEPMPGEYDLLGEFVRDLEPRILGNMLRDIWKKMDLAGEAGSLLKIEQEVRDAIREAREKLAALPPGVQLKLFVPEHPQDVPPAPAPSTVDRPPSTVVRPPSPAILDHAELRDEAFWADAENRVLEALRRYASSSAGNGKQVTRRLFASDAAQGIAFIDLFQQRFDVVLMNPPFGAASQGAKAYIAKAYPRTKNDLYAAFVERGLELLRPGGYLGAITSRTGFFLKSFQKWREEILLQEANLVAMADLGYGVLDTAMVETAAYVLEKR
jgi:hypothetical protein